jgi:predicted RNA-binding protein with PUA-like domain
MARWLFKQEPGCYSFADLQRDGSTVWDGVRNALAMKYLRQVKKGDRILFYHTGDDKAIVGEMRATAAADGVVTVAPVRRLKQPITLKQIKEDTAFASWELVRISRLSVMPVSDEIWDKLKEME